MDSIVEASPLFLGDSGKVRNNIIYDCTSGIYTNPTNENRADYNLFYKNKDNYLYNTLPGEHDIYKNPMFVNIPEADSLQHFDFHLQAFSPAIDAGDPEILDKDGTRSDIGLFGGPHGAITFYSDYPPSIPEGLIIEFDSLSNNLSISWNENDESDFSFYRVYRDTIQNFNANVQNQISAQEENTFSEILPQQNQSYFYQITAVDSQNNESAYGTEIEIIVNPITSVNPKKYFNYRIDQNYPNPFNPKTTIGYSLKEAGNVKISVYDIKGEKISTIEEGYRFPGHYKTDFSGDNLASGIYVYKLTVLNENWMPVYIDSKKMILLK